MKIEKLWGTMSSADSLCEQILSGTLSESRTVWIQRDVSPDLGSNCLQYKQTSRH